MTPTPTLRQRAERLLAASAFGALAGTSLATQADALTTADFVVEGSGVYYYNTSGYFANWSGFPDGQTVNEINPDGSVKLYGNASATSQQLLDHNCVSDTSYRGCDIPPVGDRGVALVWWGTLRRPAGVGDHISMNYDFNITMPDTGGGWKLGAALGISDFGQNNVLVAETNGDSLDGWLEAGNHHLQGVYETRALEFWELYVGSPVTYWQVSLSAHAAFNESELTWYDLYKQYMYPFHGLSISVPNQSLDIKLLGNATQPVPEPSNLALMLAGLGVLLARRRRPAA